ncbi:MAG: amidohydrolase [Chloroflexi bacterium]|nr:amidohydrolase [Chloroflexota bacterium]
MIVDCDSHFMPKDAFDYVDGPLASRRPFLKFDPRNPDVLNDIEFPGAPAPAPGTTPLPAPGSGSRYLGNANIEARMDYYDQVGIEKHFILPQFTGWWSYLIEPELANAMAHSLNLAVLNVVKESAGRIEGVALVALQDVPSAIAELEWAAAQGYKAAVIDHTFPVREHPYGTPTATHREVWPFFQKAAELGVPLFIHAVQHGHRMVNLMSFQIDGLDFFSPRDAQMNMVALITSGLLDRYPGLRFIHAEMGARPIKSTAQRMDSLFKRASVDYEDDEGGSAASRRVLSPKAPQLVPPQVAAEKNKELPSYYFRNNFYWTIETEEAELVDAVEFLGADRFLFATDYPHDDPGGTMKFKDVELLAVNKKLSEDDKELMRSANAASLFHC